MLEPCAGKLACIGSYRGKVRENLPIGIRKRNVLWKLSKTKRFNLSYWYFHTNSDDGYSFLNMVIVFLSYVIPFEQMSLLDATVITNLMSAISWVGQDIAGTCIIIAEISFIILKNETNDFGNSFKITFKNLFVLKLFIKKTLLFNN